jgi:DNA-directed RNA polymerase subunit H (RpoH/RPB5)/GTPase SAR1 family protein
VLIFYLCILGVWLVKPLLFIKLYQSKIFLLIESIPAQFGGGIIRSLRSVILDTFLLSERTLDHWIAGNRAVLIESFFSLNVVNDHQHYVSLPITEINRGVETETDLPSPESLARYFSGKRSVIQIIGNGGAGKTSLALEISRWLTDPEITNKLMGHPCVPVVIEEDNSDVFDLLKIKLKRYTDELMPDSLLKLLLRKRRLLIFLDSVSEKDQKTIDHVKTIFGQGYDLNALIITTREQYDLDISGVKYLYPQSLNSYKLLFFISKLTQKLDNRLFRTADDQLLVATYIVRLFKFNEVQLPVTPVLIRLAVDQVIEYANEYSNLKLEQVLTQMPVTIPGIYRQYLKTVNTGTVLSDEEMFEAVKIIARAVLGESFIPQIISRDLALRSLSEKFGDKGTLVLNTLVQNGVLIVFTDYRGLERARFVRDPLAEYMGAWFFAESNGADKKKWASFYKTLIACRNKPVGFIQAILIIHESFSTEENWAPPLKTEFFSSLKENSF